MKVLMDKRGILGLLGITLPVIIVALLIVFGVAVVIFKPILVIVMVIFGSLLVLLWKQSLAGMTTQSTAIAFGTIFCFGMMLLAVSVINDALTAFLSMFTDSTLLMQPMSTSLSSEFLRSGNTLIFFGVFMLLFLGMWRLPLLGGK